MAEYPEPHDRGLNNNEGVPEPNGFNSSNHSSPLNAHAQIRPHDSGNYFSNNSGYEMPMPVNHQHTRTHSGGSMGAYPPSPMGMPPHLPQQQPEQWRFSQGTRHPQHLNMPMPQAFPSPQIPPPYPPRHSMAPYPPMSGSQGYPPPYPPLRSEPSGLYNPPPHPENNVAPYPPTQPPEPTSPYLPVHSEPHSPYPPLHKDPPSPYPPMHQQEPASPYPLGHQKPTSPYPPIQQHQPPYPPPHQQPYPPTNAYPFPRAPLQQVLPQRSGLQMPAPGRWTGTQTYDQAMPYPPLEFIKAPSQDFISTYRPSTVQPSAASAAEDDHREAMRKSLRRNDSSKLRHSNDSSDSSDSSDESDVEETPKKNKMYLSDKPLPPAPSEGEGEEEETTPDNTDDIGIIVETVPAEGSTDPALLSVLSKAFATKMKEVVTLRELSCSTEYPDAFTGAEAVDTVFDLLCGLYPREHCVKVLNAMIQCKPQGLLEAVTETSQKSSHRQIVYDSLDETYRLRRVIPVGVFTGIAKCYVHGCEPGSQGCYAPRCPNKPHVYEKDVEPQEPLGRSSSMRSSIIYTEGMRSTEYWGQRMDPEFYETIEPRERDRQEALNEVTHGEEQYLKDLEIMHEYIVVPLSESGAIEPNMWPLFAKDVFNNYQELEKISSDLFEELFARQEEYEQACIPSIADILLKHFERFRDPFARYVPNVHLAEYIVALTRRSNKQFSDYLQVLQSDPHLNKQTFRHFLLRPVMRLQRYPLLLGAIIKKTDKESDDYETLMKCKEMVAEVASLCDYLSQGIKNRVEILTLNGALTCRQGEFYDLKLTDPQRKIYFRGDIKRGNSTLEVTEKYIHVVVLDHLVLLTKARKTSESTEYKIWRRPIPIQMLFIHGITNEFSLPSLLSSRTSTMHSTYTSIRTQTATRGQAPSLSLTLVHPGRHGGTYYLLCNNPEQKSQWLNAVKSAKENIKGQVDAFDLHSIDHSYFQREYDVVTTQDGPGRVTCTAPFVAVDGTQKLAIGTATGVYFKTVGGGRPRPIISMKNIMQLGVMQKYQILLVLADKELYAYPLNTLDNPKNIKSPESLAQEISDPVHFFQVGVCNGEDMLIYARQKTVSTMFTACKPTRKADQSGNNSSSGRHRSARGLFSSHGSKSGWFSTYKEFSVGARATNLHFLKSKFAVVCERAFEIIDPEDLVDGHTIPDEHDPQFDFLEQRRDGLKPLAMYRVQGKFLMVYNKFAFYVNNRNQQLVPRDESSALLCEWESHPDDVVFQYPYVLAFDPRFIEIRHVETGDLVQMIPGNDCRLTYYNGNGNTGEPLVIEGCIVREKSQYQNIFRLQMNQDVQTKTA